jgi:GPH family glycoside/pentoside/hexuronide:cation symporter
MASPPSALSIETEATPSKVSASFALAPGLQFAFSLSAFVDAAMGLVMSVYMGKVYLDVLLLPAGLYAIVVAVGRALDAITDPLLGHISDHTRSRFGRRRPYVLFGALGAGALYYLMLAPPRHLATPTLMVWFLVTYVMFFVFNTILQIPKGALAVEQTSDASVRLRLFGSMGIGVALGTLVGTLGPSMLDAIMPGQAQETQFAALAAVCGVSCALSHVWLVRSARELPEAQERGGVPFVAGVRRALRNRPFRIMFISNVLLAIPAALPGTLMPFFVQYAVGASAGWTAVLILVYLVSGFVALPFWTRLAQRHGKRMIFLINGAIGVTGGGLMMLIGPGDLTLAIVLEVYVGLQSQVWTMLSGAMSADVIDYDELLTGKRREGQFGALMSIVPKFAMIPGAAIPLAVLGGLGYIPNASTQSHEVLFAMRFMFALVPAVFNAAGVAIMRVYTLTEARHELIREGIARHARGESATDPITGKLVPPVGKGTVDDDTGWFLDTFSIRELRAYARGSLPMFSVLACCAASLGLMVAGVLITIATVPSFTVDPGPIPALAIVASGSGLTALIFHGLRVRPAQRLRAQPIERETVVAHLGA